MQVVHHTHPLLFSAADDTSDRNDEILTLCWSAKEAMFKWCGEGGVDYKHQAKVILIEEKSATLGLKKVGDVRGKTSGLIGFHTAGSADKKSMKKLKEEAAEMGAAFVLITLEKDNQFTTQSIKRGIGFSYK